MPLSLLKSGDTCIISVVKGSTEQKKFLENLGFLSGVELSVVTVNSGDMIVRIKGSTIALGNDMTRKILVKPV